YQRLTTKTGGGGGGAVKAAKDFTAANRAVAEAVKAVARAERDVKAAQADALAMQNAINEARETASDRLRDQALDLEGAQLDQADAAAAVAQAQTDLNEALARGDTSKIQEARSALAHAELAAKQAAARVDDLTEANAKNTKTGVEGSDEVVAAKKREKESRQRVADSIEAEKDAERRLAEARRDLAKQKAEPAGGGGGGGGGGQQITKLAPAAREFLNTIIGLRPAFERLRLGVQQKLFAGLADKMSHLAEVWKGPLTKTLGSFATTFNSIAKTVFSSVSKKSFVDNMTSGMESFRVALKSVADAVGGPLIDAFGRLSRTAGPFVRKLGSLLGGVITDFSNWIKRLDKSGSLDRFFKGAAGSLDKVWKLGRNVFAIVGKMIGIIFGQTKSAGDSVFDTINAGLANISKWLDDPANQKKIQAILNGIIEVGKTAWAIIKKLFSPSGIGPSPFARIIGGIESALAVLKLLNSAIGKLQKGIQWVQAN
ncbi:hypothetical protein, partial [Staphylococcus capitis]|uniref:hypothetical protein n=1 Tax=Staphylococcus capitis TaxID=29388 RepID=UPI003CFDF55A